MEHQSDFCPIMSSLQRSPDKSTFIANEMKQGNSK